MNSVKNLFVVVMLMGVSYGAFQVINTPDPTSQDQTAQTDQIDIQMGERNHTSLQEALPQLDPQTSDSPSVNNFANETKPNFPPLPPNVQQNDAAPRSQSFVSDSTPSATSSPQLKVPDLEMPKLNSPPAQFQNEPTTQKAQPPVQILTPPSEFKKDPGSFQSQPDISEPPISGPPVDDSARQFAKTPKPETMNSNPPIDRNQFADNSANSSKSLGGQGAFNPNPETHMEPVTPKTNVAPPTAGNRFIDPTNQIADGINQAKQNIQQGVDQQVDRLKEQAQPFVDPAKQFAQNTLENTTQSFNKVKGNAAEMLNHSKSNLIDRVNEISDRANEIAEAGSETMVNVVEESLSPLKGATGQGRATLPSPNASPNIDWDGINQMASSGQVKNALSTLSKHYSANVTEDQRLQMLDWLDTLAGKVIYSTEHHLSSAPYVVQQNDTLETLAQKWKVPAQLIYNVNRSKIGDPTMLMPGTELKVIEGPFNAMISMDRQQLTLFLNDMYAGRFPVQMGQDSNGIAHGNFLIQEKSPGKAYTVGGANLAAGATNNPYGRYWLGLGNGMGIHEFDSANLGTADQRGSIRVSSSDAADVYGILSNGSQVTITR